MSKETMVIVLGLWVIVIRTILGVPGNWQTFLFIITGAALAVIGFLLRGEALGRTHSNGGQYSKKSSYSFVENDTTPVHEHKEGITSLN